MDLLHFVSFADYDRQNPEILIHHPVNISAGEAFCLRFFLEVSGCCRV